MPRLALSLRISSRLHPTTASDASPSNILRGYSSLPPHYLRPFCSAFRLASRREMVAKFHHRVLHVTHAFIRPNYRRRPQSDQEFYHHSLRASSANVGMSFARFWWLRENADVLKAVTERKLVRYSLTRWINFSLVARVAFNRRGERRGTTAEGK